MHTKVRISVKILLTPTLKHSNTLTIFCCRRATFQTLLPETFTLKNSHVNMLYTFVYLLQLKNLRKIKKIKALPFTKYNISNKNTTLR